MLDTNDVVGCRPLYLQPLIEPAQGRSHRAILLAKPLDELHGEGSDQRVAFESREAQRRRRDGTVRADAEQLVSEDVGLLARRAPANNALRQAPKILDEHDAQRDRHCPQLADRQRLHALVGTHEPPERFGIESAIGVRNERPGDSVDARIAGERPLGQLGQLPIEPGRQVVADLAQLLVHDVEVVDEPFRRRRDRALLADGVGDHAVRVAKHAAVVFHALQQPPPPTRPPHDALGRRQALGVLLESLDAEELGTDRVVGGLPSYPHADFLQGFSCRG